MGLLVIKNEERDDQATHVLTSEKNTRANDETTTSFPGNEINEMNDENKIKKATN